MIKKIDNLAQMQVLEAIVVVGLILTSLYFVQNLNITSYSIIHSDNRLETLGRGVLISLESKPDPSGNSSLLEKCVREYINKGEYTTFKRYIDDGLPSGTVYKILLINISELTHNKSATIDNCTEVIYMPPLWVDEGFRSSRLVVVDGYIYNVILSMWFNLRR